MRPSSILIAALRTSAKRFAFKPTASLVLNAGLATRSERAAKQAPTNDPLIVQKLFDKLQAGMAPVIAANAGRVKVERDEAVLRLAGPDGKGFIISTESMTPPTIRLQSTASTGLAKSEMFYNYRYQPNIDQWVCVTDGHFLLELLTRDVVYHFNGVPSW